MSEQITDLDASHPAGGLRVLRPAVERLRMLDREIGETRVQLGQDPVTVDYEVRPRRPRGGCPRSSPSS